MALRLKPKMFSDFPRGNGTIGFRPKTMREVNSRDLLRLLRHHMPCSRADLVRLSGLTAPTVSAAIEALQRRGLVRFTGPGNPKGGRPPRILEFNQQCACVLAADIGGSGVRLALADLGGNIIGTLNRLFTYRGTPDEVVALCAEGVQSLLEENGVSRQKVLQFVAGAPGITDVRNGTVRSAPNLRGWHDIPLAEQLERQTGLPTAIENDVNLGAVGEGRCGVATAVQNFVFVAIGSGVGAGIVIDGDLFHGANWSAGEVGYMQVPGLAGEPLSLNRLGALETSIGGKGIRNAWLACTGGSRGTQHQRPTEIFDLAIRGDRCAVRVLETTSQHLATAIANISLVLDTQLVVLGGGIGGHPALVEATRKALARNDFARPEVVAGGLGSNAQLHGAIWLAIQIAEHRGFYRQSVAHKGTRTGIKSHIAR